MKPKSVKTLAWVGGGQQLSEDRGNVWLVSWPSNPRSVAGSIVLWVWHTFNNIGRSMDCWTEEEEIIDWTFYSVAPQPQSLLPICISINYIAYHRLNCQQ